MNFRAILFDLGDTLLDFEPMDARALYREGARLSYDRLAAGGGDVIPFDRYANGYFRALKWAYIWAKLSGREFNSLELLRSFHQRNGIVCDEELLREISWLWYEPVTRHARVEESLKPTLAGLRSAGLKLGVLSNTFVPGFIHDRHLELAGLLEFFPVRIYSSEVGFRKPNRRIFEAASAQMGIAAEETLFVGDLVKTDIIGARRVGMRTALKQPFANLRRHRIADHVIRKIADLLDVIPALAMPVPER